MRIKLNILPQYFCAHLYAKRDSKAEEPYCIEGVFPTTSIRLIPVKFTTNYDNDHFIEFKSDVPFNIFCMRLSLSEYNLPENYHIIKHNCAHAAAYALQVAGIKLTIPSYIPFNRIGTLPFSKTMGFSFSPLDLHEIVKDYKIQTIKKNNIASLYECTKSNILLWRSKARNQYKIDLVDTIIRELDVRVRQHEEHIEIHLNMLMETLTFIKNKPQEISRQHYNACANYFKYRNNQYRGDFGALYYNAAISLMTTWLVGIIFLSKEQQNEYLARFFLMNILCLGLAMFVLKMPVSRSTQSPTLLSNSMNELANLSKCPAPN